MIVDGNRVIGLCRLGIGLCRLGDLKESGKFVDIPPVRSRMSRLG